MGGKKIAMIDPESIEHKAIEKELFQLARDWADAMITNDADRIGAFMADEWVMVSERGIATKEHFLSFVRSGALTHSSFSLAGPPPRVRIYGDTAVISSRVVSTARFGGHESSADEWTTDVMVLREGRWLCVLSQITNVDKEFEEMLRQRNSGTAA